MNKKDLVKIFQKYKKYLIILGVIILLLASFYFVMKLFADDSPKQVYEAAIEIKDKKNAKKDSSLMRGDVLLLKKGDSNAWSKTELLSYLIIKMELTDEQSRLIVQPLERDLSSDEKKEELESFKEGMGDDLPKEELDRYKEELDNRKKTVLYRQYTIDMKELGDPQPNDLLKGQPLGDEIYDWGIVEEKDE